MNQIGPKAPTRGSGIPQLIAKRKMGTKPMDITSERLSVVQNRASGQIWIHVKGQVLFYFDPSGICSVPNDLLVVPRSQIPPVPEVPLISENPRAAKFVSAQMFSGPMDGYQFMKGEFGIGYYRI